MQVSFFMFGLTWKTSEREYKVIVERDVRVKMSDGVQIDADIFRPESNNEKFPAILSVHPYSKSGQTEPIKVNSHSALTPHKGEERTRGSLEAGDPYFFARRGYAHIVANVRGTGKSGDYFELLGEREVRDVYEIIEWLAGQSWCTGSVGMFGVSYFAMIQLSVAALNPPHLKCIFAPWGTTDMYRDMFYQGGILASQWTTRWPQTSFVYGNVRPKSIATEELGTARFDEELSKLSKDEELSGDPLLIDAINNPEKRFANFVNDILIHSLYGDYWEERRSKTERIKIPSYIGGDWGIYRSHLPAAFRSWETISAPKMMIIGPPAYLDRPLYQLQYESLRWFDYWLKGIDTAILQEPSIRVYVMGSGKWKSAGSWPLPETKWTPFYLHENSLLSERDYWPNEGSSSYFDSPWSRGYLEFFSPRLVEDTEVIGPIVANLFASSTDDELLFSLRILEENSKGERKILTAGWLRGSHREIDPARSKPWYPFHPHNRRETLEPGKIYEFKIPIVPTGNLFRGGSRIGLRIGSIDYDSESSIGGLASGHVKRQYPSRISIHHNDDFPSNLLLPVTSGNIIGTYMSEGKPYV